MFSKKLYLLVVKDRATRTRDPEEDRFPYPTIRKDTLCVFGESPKETNKHQ